MSALAEALVAAQARAVAALGKQLLAAHMDTDTVRAHLHSIGLTDEIDAERWIFALGIIRACGEQAPGEQKPNGPDRSKATDAQISLMEKIAKERNYTMPDDAKLLSRDHASQVIASMKAGEYDYAEWRVAF